MDTATCIGTDPIASRAELRDLYDDYVACLDSGDFAAFPDFFTPDALYQVISRENHDAGHRHAPIYCSSRAMIVDRLMALKEAALYQPRSLRHFTSGLRITGSDDDAVRAEANFLVIEALLEQEPQVLMVGCYVDRLVRINGALKFRERTCVYDNYRIRTTLVIPV